MRLWACHALFRHAWGQGRDVLREVQGARHGRFDKQELCLWACAAFIASMQAVQYRWKTGESRPSSTSMYSLVSLNAEHSTMPPMPLPVEWPRQKPKSMWK